jgi:hypothetical protein
MAGNDRAGAGLAQGNRAAGTPEDNRMNIAQCDPELSGII